MLTIRMQRRGRSGHAQFRVVVQDSRFSPTSGRVVAYVGSYDPHTKAATLDSDKISSYLATGAQPSDRVAKLLSKEGIKVPDWFKPSAPKKKAIRHPDKRRSTRLPGEKIEKPVEVEAPVVEATDDEPTEVAEEATESAHDTPVEEDKATKTTEVEETPAAEEPAPEVKAETETKTEISKEPKSK